MFIETWTWIEVKRTIQTITLLWLANIKQKSGVLIQSITFYIYSHKIINLAFFDGISNEVSYTIDAQDKSQEWKKQRLQKEGRCHHTTNKRLLCDLCFLEISTDWHHLRIRRSKHHGTTPSWGLLGKWFKREVLPWQDVRDICHPHPNPSKFISMKGYLSKILMTMTQKTMMHAEA